MKQEKETTTGTKLSPEEIKRVKGLGCLKDKRYDDIFNIRVITRNGRITTDEHRAIGCGREVWKWRNNHDNTTEYGNPGSTLR